VDHVFMTEADTLKGDSLISQQYLEVSWRGFFFGGLK